MNTAIYPGSLPQRFVREQDSETRPTSPVATEAEKNPSCVHTAEQYEVFFDDREVYGGY
jgi:hypothetical protein